MFNHTLNTTFRLLGSKALNHSTKATGNGVLLFGQAGITPKDTPDWVYLNAFWAIDKFSSAARAPDQGGPLGRAGLLFDAVGLGRYGSALGNEANNSVGFALGYQMFFDTFRRQLVVEVGARKDTKGASQDAVALGGRFQQAFGRHLLLRFDSFISGGKDRGPGYGGRTELMVKF
jgi:hypothetical protein